MIYIAKVPIPEAPFSMIHVALYAYFPRAAQGERPFVWRVADEGKSAVIMSSVAPTTDYAEISIEAGRTYQFALTYKRVRNCKRRPIEITSPDELRERLKRWTGERGGHVGFVRIERPRYIKFQKAAHRVDLPIADAEGAIYIADAGLFEAAMVGGGPGTGKVYGLGLWWLPEIMGPALASISRRAA